MNGEAVHICEKSVIVDGILCSIMKVISNTNNDEELAAFIVSGILEEEIKASWLKLFLHFKDVHDENRKIPVKDIKRQSVRAMVDDILRCLRIKELTNDLHVLVLPWYYNVHAFVTESQKVDHAWQKETIAENEKRINELETRLEAKFEKKQTDLISKLNSWSDSLLRTLQPNSYASVAASQILPSFHTNNPPKTPLGLPVLNLPSSDKTLFKTPSVSSNNMTDFRNRLGSLGNGQKRVRVEPQNGNRASKESSVKTVVGTSSSNKNGRKMRSPPADIFKLREKELL